MVELRLVGLSEDRQRLVLQSPSGQEFTVAVDDRLRAALRGDRARLGQLEIQMDSALRPRDIQARIRAGESPESVAEVAQVPVDKIMGYAVPVLAEREHMAERAQRSAIRRKGGDGPARILGETVSERLRSDNVDPASAGWDAWRREDGKWTVTVTHTAGGREQAAHFTFDALGRYAVAEDDAARRLLGEAAPDRPTQQRPRPARRLAAVTDRPENPARLFDDEDELTAVADAVRAEQTQTDPAEAPEDAPEEAPEPAPDEPPTEDRPEEPATETAETAADTTADTTGRPETAEEEEPAGEEPKRRGRKSRGRASVPSWDEIMFGRTKE